MNMARSTFYKRPHAGHRAAREKADTDLRVRIEDIPGRVPRLRITDGSRTSSGDVAW